MVLWHYSASSALFSVLAQVLWNVLYMSDFAAQNAKWPNFVIYTEIIHKMQMGKCYWTRSLHYATYRQGEWYFHKQSSMQRTALQSAQCVQAQRHSGAHYHHQTLALALILDQCCPTCGPRATCSPRADFTWTAACQSSTNFSGNKSMALTRHLRYLSWDQLNQVYTVY